MPRLFLFGQLLDVIKHAQMDPVDDLVRPKLRNFFLMIMPGPWISKVDNPGNATKPLHTQPHEMGGVRGTSRD